MGPGKGLYCRHSVYKFHTSDNGIQLLFLDLSR